MRTGIDPVICEYMVWIAGSMTSWAINIWPACRSASLRCQKMKASAFSRKTGLPLSLGPGAMMKSSSLKPAFFNTPCAHPPMINMPDVAVDEALQIGGIGLGADIGVHPVGELAHLCEGSLHLGTLQGLLVEIHAGGAVCRRD